MLNRVKLLSYVVQYTLYDVGYLEWTPIDTMPTSYIKTYRKRQIV